MSNNATKKEEPTAGPSTGGAKVEEKKKLPQLGALEDDDEFEEFSADGECFARSKIVLRSKRRTRRERGAVCRVCMGTSMARR